MTGRDSAETSGYLPSYSAFALIARATYSRPYSSRASTTSASIAPAASARRRRAPPPRAPPPPAGRLPVLGVGVGDLAHVDRHRHDLGAPLLLDPPDRDGR